MERVARSTLATAAVIAAMILALLVPGGAARADHVGQQLLSVETPDGLDDFPVVSPDGEWVIFPANRASLTRMRITFGFASAPSPDEV